MGNASLNAITDFYDDAPPASDGSFEGGPFKGVPFVVKPPRDVPVQPRVSEALVELVD